MRNKNKAFENERGNSSDKKPGAAVKAVLGNSGAGSNLGLNLGANVLGNSNNINNIHNNNIHNNCINANVVGNLSGINSSNINSNISYGIVKNANNGNVHGMNGNSGIDYVIANNNGNHNKHLSGINSSFSNLNLSGIDNHLPHCLQNSMIKDSFFIQIIGLKISVHPDSLKLSKDLNEHFKSAKVSIIKLNDNQSYGTRVFFDSEEYMNKLMNSNKSHKVVLDGKLVKLKKKQAKEGNRLYAIYFDFLRKKGE